MINTARVLVIGDLHAPFEHKDYLNHCKAVAKEYKTTHTIFIGDVIDSHAASFHDSDVDGYSAGHELREARVKLQDWHKAFPNADVVIGNHDLIFARKIKASGVPSEVMRSLTEILNVPSWRFKMKYIYDDVLYLHGQGVTARTKALRTGLSVVQGHRHTEGYVWFQPTEMKQLWGMQVGTGIDVEAYAFDYAKDHPPAVLSCGVILREGRLPILIPMI